MIHYPRCIRKIGPLLYVWCMRFKAKHYFFNITKTLVKHQRHLAYHWENVNFHRFEFGPVKKVIIDSLEGGELLSDLFYVDLNSEVSTSN